MIRSGEEQYAEQLLLKALEKYHADVDLIGFLDGSTVAGTRRGTQMRGTVSNEATN